MSGVIFRMPSDQLLIIWHKSLHSLPCIHSAPFINSAMSSTIGRWQAFCFNVTGSIRPMSMPLTASCRAHLMISRPNQAYRFSSDCESPELNSFQSDSGSLIDFEPRWNHKVCPSLRVSWPTVLKHALSIGLKVFFILPTSKLHESRWDRIDCSEVRSFLFLS